MKIAKISLWDKVPGMCEETPELTAYIPNNKGTDAAIVILPGGGYRIRSTHEGDAYASFLCQNGVTAFVCNYRVSPHLFPLPLLDARRAIRYVRYFADKYGINKNKVAVMGSSAGGHLVALTSTYYEPIMFENIDEIDKENYIPNAQILCYPVIKLASKREGAHIESSRCLLGEKVLELADDITPEYLVSKKTPKCFIWHTFEDMGVSMMNSMDYVKALKKNGVSTELHIFPRGGHGLGLANGENEVEHYVSQWTRLLLNWISTEL